MIFIGYHYETIIRIIVSYCRFMLSQRENLYNKNLIHKNMIIHLTNYQITLKGPSYDGKLNGLSILLICF